MIDLHTMPPSVILAVLIWGEARGEPIQGQIAVANVVRNRVLHRNDLNWLAVCLADRQFSCFNVDDPNYHLIQRAVGNLTTALPTPELAQAKWIADGVMAGVVKDNTKGATHYLETVLLTTKPPAWAVNQPVLVEIGHHSFLKVA